MRTNARKLCFQWFLVEYFYAFLLSTAKCYLLFATKTTLCTPKILHCNYFTWRTREINKVKTQMHQNFDLHSLLVISVPVGYLGAKVTTQLWPDIHHLTISIRNLLLETFLMYTLYVYTYTYIHFYDQRLPLWNVHIPFTDFKVKLFSI